MSSTTTRSGLLSIILLSYNSERRLLHAFQEVDSAMIAANIDYELILMDDGSVDNSFQIAKSLAQANLHVRAYRLSKNFTSPYSHFAGYSVAQGQCVVTIADDLQKPLQLVVDMYRSWQSGNDVVVSYRSTRDDGWLSDFFSNAYYKLMNATSDVKYPPGGSDGVLIDKQVLDIINTKISKRNTSPIIEVLRLGFDPHFIPYDRPPSTGKSRWTFSKKIKYASDNFFSSSSLPIKLITWLGFGISTLSFTLIILILSLKLFSSNQLFGLPIPGWATIVILLCFFNGIVLLSLGIVAQYIWRIYEAVKGNPAFIIRKEE